MASFSALVRTNPRQWPPGPVIVVEDVMGEWDAWMEEWFGIRLEEELSDSEADLRPLAEEMASDYVNRLDEIVTPLPLGPKP